VPSGLTANDLIDCLAAQWDLDIVGVDYVPVGGGSHHWLAHGTAGQRHWLSVDDLDHKDFLGDTRAATLSGLCAAFETALALGESGLEFVVAPQRSRRGEAVEPLGTRYAVAVFPFLDGSSGRFGVPLAASEREQLVDMLVRLHQATPVVRSVARPARIQPASRAGLEDALGDLDQEWVGGPYSEMARAALASRAGAIRRLLSTFDQLADELAARCSEPVVTHGEPHPGNVMRADGRLFLVDWDTVALGPPGRDLWMLGSELTRYTRAAARQVDPSALRLYRLRWLLDDIGLFACGLRSHHDRTADTEHAWRSLTLSLASPDINAPAH
jgi:spectinomycin phosphotransferase